MASKADDILDAIRYLSKADDVIDTVKFIENIWSLPASVRGYLFETMPGGMVNNFPVTDKFVNRAGSAIASSITSIRGCSY